MKKLKLIILFGCFCGFYCCEGNSQNPTIPPPKKIIVEQDPAKQKIAYINLNKSSYSTDRIDFKDEKGKVTTSFDVKASNPFNQLDLPDDGYNTFGGKVYPLKEIAPQRYQQVLGLSSNARSKNISFVAAESQTTVYQKAPNYALVAYNLFLYDGFGETFEAQSEIILLNQEGKEIQRFHLPHIARVPLVTDNGKYFFANYGGAYNCTHFEYVPQGFRVYNTNTGKLIYEESREGKENLHPASHFNVFSFPYYRGSKDTYRIYDFESKIIYSRDFTPKELGYSSYVKGGMRVKDTTGQFVIITYEKNFTKIPLNLKK